jgi:hypothetical protein
MKTFVSKATRTSAVFGQGTINVSGFNVYTLKLRLKQFDLLRLAIESAKEMYGDLCNLNRLNCRLVHGKNHNTYAYYEFATTDAEMYSNILRGLDLCRADVKMVEYGRLMTGDRHYLSDAFSTTLARLREMEETRFHVCDDDDLPF